MKSSHSLIRRRFLLYITLMLASYFAAIYSYNWWHGGLTVSSSEYLPVSNLLIITFLIYEIVKNDKYKKSDFTLKKPFTILGALASFAILVASFHMIWLAFDTTYYAVFFIAYFVLAVVMFAWLFPWFLTEIYQHLLMGLSGVYLATLFIYLGLLYNWTILADSIVYLLSFIIPHPEEMTLQMGNFWVTIGPACTGVNSLLMFATLFGSIGIIFHQTKRLKLKKYLIASLGGLALLYILNNLRIVILLLIGSHYSPELALTLFHSYLGAILFFFVILAYYKWVITWIVCPRKKSP
jgi:exosortase/archaeosortase family protein